MTDIDNKVQEEGQEQVAQEEQTLESVQLELAAMKDQWLRAVAETDNVRKRAQKDKEDTLKYAITSFARDILSVSDNMRRALETCGNLGEVSEPVKSLITGVEMTEQELLKVLDRHGIRIVTPVNEKFDPHYHQAMFEVPTAEVEPGTVVQVMQSGYVLHDRLLRPALVSVAKLP